MKVVHVLRKPCSEGTVAANVLRWGTGALNIDAGRVGTEGGGTVCTNRDEAGRCRGHNNAGRSTENKTFHGPDTHGGRWPANLVLQHLDGCVQDGVKKVKAMGATGSRYAGTEGPANINTGGAPLARRAWVSEDSTETVAAWACAPGCPVARLDEQSGVLHGRGNKASPGHGSGSGSGVTGWGKDRADSAPRPELNDAGGASRFFKQVGGATKPPTDG